MSGPKHFKNREQVAMMYTAFVFNSKPDMHLTTRIKYRIIATRITVIVHTSVYAEFTEY